MDSQKNRPLTLSTMVLTCCIAAGCVSTTRPRLTAEQEAAISNTVLSLTEAYNAAWEGLRAGPILQFHGDDFQYYWFDQRVSDDFEEVLRTEWLAGIEEYSIEMIDPQVKVLGADAAVVSFQFVDRETTDGSVQESSGALGYIFERQAGEWKIVRIHHSGSVPERYRNP